MYLQVLALCKDFFISNSDEGKEWGLYISFNLHCKSSENLSILGNEGGLKNYE